MISKISTIEEALEQIENCDRKIELCLEKDDLTSILNILKIRLTAIAEIYRLKGQSDLSIQDQERLDQISSKADLIQNKVQEKRDKIKERLAKSKKIKNQNKKIGYINP